MQILQWVVVNPSCPVGKNNKYRYTVPRFDLHVLFVRWPLVISGSEVKFHVKGFSKGARELGDKLGAAVRGDVVRNAMLRENMNDK